MSELLLDVGQMRDPEARIERTFAAGVLPTDPRFAASPRRSR